MSDEEISNLRKKQKKIQIRTLLNQIDYEDIVQPIKTTLSNPIEVILEGGKTRTGIFNFKLHEFSDNTSRLQLLNQPTQTEFYNVDIETSEDKVIELT